MTIMEPTNRVIILIDMDCFYCQVEEKLNPKLKDQPVAVVQYNAWRGGGIIAVNYPAREQGVTRHMRGNDAKKKCPSINLVRVPEVRGKADLTKYRDAGKEVADVLATFTPLLERASVDEAYLDISELVKERIETGLQDLCPNNLQNTFIVGHTLDDFLHNAIANKEFSEDNLKLAVGGLISEEIRQEVYNKTGYKCSAGIAHNKILAKLVCSLHKPNKQTILPHEAVDNFFETIPISKIKSLGGKFGQTLSEDLQITYMGQLKNFTIKELMQKYDEKTAKWLYNVARGIDLEPVTAKLISKSIACSKQFQGKAALTTSETIQYWLNELADELVERLEKDLKENNRKAKHVVVSFSHKVDKTYRSNSRTNPITSYDSRKIGQSAFEVIKKFCLKPDGTYNLNYLGLNASHFEDIKRNREITSFFKPGHTENAKFGNHIASNSSVNEQLSEGVPNENIASIDSKLMTDNDVFLQATQELNENINDLIFYDDSCRVVKSKKSDCKKLISKNIKHSKKSLPNRSLSSFFKQYFHQGEQNGPLLATYKEQTASQSTVNDDEMCNKVEICFECNTSIPVFEFMSHKDYHLALKLAKNINTTNQASTSVTRTKTKSTILQKNKKINSQKDLMSFFNSSTTDQSELQETCSECKRKIRTEDLNTHMDYHIAKRLHLDLNARN